MNIFKIYSYLPLALLITALLSQGAFADIVAMPMPTPEPMPVPTVEPTPAPMPNPESLPDDSQLFSSGINYLGLAVIGVISVAFLAITRIKGNNR